MTRKPLRVFSHVSLAVAITASSAVAQSRAPVTPFVARAPELDSTRALETFDAAWGLVRDGYYDAAIRGLDWNAVSAELRPRAARARSIVALREVLDEMLSRIGESHFALMPSDVGDALASEAADARNADGGGDVGVEVRLAEGRLVVSRVVAGSAASRAGVHAGWTIDAVNDRAVPAMARTVGTMPDGRARQAALMHLPRTVEQSLRGAVGSSVRVSFRDGADRPTGIRLVRQASNGEAVRFGNLPTLFVELSTEKLVDTMGCVGVIRFNFWMPSVAVAFDRAMSEVRDCRGIVLDLRGNPGGVAAMVMGISGYFVAEPVTLGVMHNRGSELRFVANPRRVSAAGEEIATYRGRLAILVDALSVSTTEMFAVGMQRVGRARIFGEITAGQALPAVMTRLPNGDVLMHVVADFTAPDGSRIEGRGAIPDEIVPIVRADLLAGRDAPLAAAQRWIGEPKPPRTHMP